MHVFLLFHMINEEEKKKEKVFYLDHVDIFIKFFLIIRVRMTTTIVLVAALVFMHHKRNFMWNIWSLIIEEYRHLTNLN